MADRQLEVVVSPMLQQTEELLEYWSEQAMAEAEPLLPELDPGSVEQMLLEAEEQAESSDHPSESPDGAAALAPEPQPPAPPTGSRTEQVPNRGVLPYCPVGKLFMTFDGRNFVGSAWTTAGSGVFTAGHCVFDRDGGGWADKVLFVPQYHDGAAPRGNWTAVQIASLRGWTENRDFKYDMAAFKTDRPIQPATGSLGWMANFPPDQGPFTSVGYPSAAHPTHGFNGQRMWRSTGRFRSGPNPVQMWNDMTRGCSGGPWVVWKNGQVYANGLNSFRYTNDPASMYSPYFGEGLIALYNWVK